jgi:hypothetical protein
VLLFLYFDILEIDLPGCDNPGSKRADHRGELTEVLHRWRDVRQRSQGLQIHRELARGHCVRTELVLVLGLIGWRARARLLAALLAAARWLELRTARPTSRSPIGPAPSSAERGIGVCQIGAPTYETKVL